MTHLPTVSAEANCDAISSTDNLISIHWRFVPIKNLQPLITGHSLQWLLQLFKILAYIDALFHEATNSQTKQNNQEILFSHGKALEQEGPESVAEGQEYYQLHKWTTSEYYVIPLLKGFLNTGIGSQGKCLSHHPWKCLKETEMWYHGLWFSNRLGRVWQWLDSILKVSSNRSDSMIPLE